VLSMLGVPTICPSMGKYQRTSSGGGICLAIIGWPAHSSRLSASCREAHSKLIVCASPISVFTVARVGIEQNDRGLVSM
jgi:hypothetical protein